MGCSEGTDSEKTQPPACGKKKTRRVTATIPTREQKKKKKESKKRKNKYSESRKKMGKGKSDGNYRSLMNMS